MSDDEFPLREVLIEFRPQGKYVRVCAIDPITLTEVILVGDPKQGEETLKRIAARKLLYVLNKRRKEGKL